MLVPLSLGVLLSQYKLYVYCSTYYLHMHTLIINSIQLNLNIQYINMMKLVKRLGNGGDLKIGNYIISLFITVFIAYLLNY